MTDLDNSLGHELRSLGAALPEIDVVGAVHAELATEPTPNRLLRAAAIVVLALAAVLAIPDAREAAADWLGIGRTSVSEVDELPAATSTTSLPAETAAPTDIAAAEAALGLDIPLPSDALVGAVRAIDADAQRTIIVWDSVSLTVRPVTADTPLFQKFVDDPDDIERLVLADGADAIWVAADHVILRGDAAEAVGSVLLWTEGDAEYRLADAPDLATAIAIAESVG